MKHKFNFINFLKKNKIFKKVFAFSLVELMISLITISCIAAAFAPVITKKLNKSSVAVRSGNQLLSDCSKFNQDGKYNCKACYPDQCIVCTLTCPVERWLDLKQCTCRLCIGNSNDPKNPNPCLSCVDGTTCNRCKAGYYKNGNSCADCPAGKCCPEGSTEPLPECPGHYKINN